MIKKKTLTQKKTNKSLHTSNKWPSHTEGRKGIQPSDLSVSLVFGSGLTLQHIYIPNMIRPGWLVHLSYQTIGSFLCWDYWNSISFLDLCKLWYTIVILLFYKSLQVIHHATSTTHHALATPFTPLVNTALLSTSVGSTSASTCGICLSVTDLSHVTSYPPAPCMPSCQWQNITLLYIAVTVDHNWLDVSWESDQRYSW